MPQQLNNQPTDRPTHATHSGVVALSFLSMVEALTYANTFFLFALSCAASTVFYAFLLPETKARSEASESNKPHTHKTDRRVMHS